jgi:dimethylglycine dehydrogenase
VTSGCFSPALGKGLAFGYIPAFLDVPGTEVEVEMMGQKRKATVRDGPPVQTQPIREKMGKE